MFEKRCPGVGNCITLNANIEIVKNITQKYESKQSTNVQFCQEGKVFGTISLNLYRNFLYRSKVGVKVF